MAVAAGLSAVAWLAVLLRPDRPWALRPIAEDQPDPPEPAVWPPVAVVVPARNEARLLPRTLPALLAQDYPGACRTIVVDDRSDDGTAVQARRLGADVVDGEPLPRGWAGKVWALEQGRLAAGAEPWYLLLTDADIRHAPGSLRRLVAEAEADGLALTSRMARLCCATGPEKLLIPPFLFFFNLLYPMRRVNEPGSRVAAAAGGCVLVRRDVLEAIGGFGAIAGELIDDVNLARRIKRESGRIRLAVSARDVVSLREYGSIAAVWQMVRRTAFDELGYSWPLLAGTVAALGVLFVAPPAAVGLGLARRRRLLALGAGAWALSAAAVLPTTRYFGLHPAWALTLPLGGTLFGGMTLDSALRHVRGLGGRW